MKASRVACFCLALQKPIPMLLSLLLKFSRSLQRRLLLLQVGPSSRIPLFNYVVVP